MWVVYNPRQHCFLTEAGLSLVSSRLVTPANRLHHSAVSTARCEAVAITSIVAALLQL